MPDKSSCHFFIRQRTNLPNLCGSLDASRNADICGLIEPLLEKKFLRLKHSGYFGWKSDLKVGLLP